MAKKRRPELLPTTATRERDQREASDIILLDYLGRIVPASLDCNSHTEAPAATMFKLTRTVIASKHVRVPFHTALEALHDPPVLINLAVCPIHADPYPHCSSSLTSRWS